MRDFLLSSSHILTSQNMESVDVKEKPDRPVDQNAAEKVASISDGEGELLQTLGYKVSDTHELAMSR